jgi:hypothetical protein
MPKIARIVGDEDEIAVGSDVPTFLAGLADVGVMAGSAGDGNGVDAQAFIDQKPHYNGTDGERPARSADGPPMAAARPAPQWVGGGIDRGQVDHLEDDNLIPKAVSPHHQQH